MHAALIWFDEFIIILVISAAFLVELLDIAIFFSPLVSLFGFFSSVINVQLIMNLSNSSHV